MAHEDPQAKDAASVAAPDRAARARELLDRARERVSARDEARARDRQRDTALVGKAKAGDVAAFTRLVELHQGRLFAVAFGILRDRDEAMDVVQDAFIKVHKKLGDFEGTAAFSTWLHRICVNLCIDKKRAETRRRAVSLDDGATELSEDSVVAGADVAPLRGGASPQKNVSDRELGSALQTALDGLSPEHRAILLLREVEGQSYEEIADALSIPKGTVMSRLFHARKNAQRLLRPYLGLADGDALGGGAADDGAASGDEASAAARRRTS